VTLTLLLRQISGNTLRNRIALPESILKWTFLINGFSFRFPVKQFPFVRGDFISAYTWYFWGQKNFPIFFKFNLSFALDRYWL
jgi:hypothetical protein